MSYLNKIIMYCSDSNYRFVFNAKHGCYKKMSDDEYLKRMYRARMGCELNLNNPATYNEKLQWLKLYDRNAEYTSLVDKYKVKKIVAKLIGEEYVIPLLGVWEKPSQINFDSLPNQFVLKCTHDSQGLVICKDKSALDYEIARNKIGKALKRNYYYFYREWPYKNVVPQIIAEKYMVDESGLELKDYKVMCFNGEPKIIQLHSGRFTKHQTQDFYDTKWNKLTISQSNSEHYWKTDNIAPKPSTLDKMVELSKVLSKGIPHVRIDWYSVRSKLYFGEFTFFDGSGYTPFDNPEDDLMIGRWIELPNEEQDA